MDFSYPLTRFGAATEAVDLFGALDDGSTIATVAFGGEAPAVARRGDGQMLRGELDQVPDALAADTLLVPVGDEACTELVAVTTSSPSVDIVSTPGIDQSRKTFRVRLDDASGRVMAVADGQAMQALVDDVLIARAADALGAARQVLAMTVDYAKVRRQFGQPIGSFQAIAHLCVDMLETVELARSGVLYALWAADSADPIERHRAALRVKAFAGRLAGVADMAIQVFGGIGFTWEHDAQLYLKRLLSFSRFLGNPGDYLQQLGAALAGRDRNRALEESTP